MCSVIFVNIPVEHLVYTSCHCSSSCVSVLVYVGISLDPWGSCTCLEMED